MPFIPEQHRLTPKPIKDTTLKDAFRWRETWKCFVLTIIIVAFIIDVILDPLDYGLSKNSSWITYSYCVVGFLFIYTFYMVECRYSDIVCDLAEPDLTPISEVHEYIIRLKRSEPQVWWQASCFHFVQPKSPRRSSRIPSRVNMHVSKVAFDYRNFGFTDISDCLMFHQKSPLLKIGFSKGFAFARPRHAEEYESIRNEFFSALEPVDDHIEKKEGIDLPGVEFEAFIHAGKFPWFINTATYWICSSLLLSWPYRIYVNYITAHAHFKVIKLFGHVRMIPSYSEAMLMDPAPPAYFIDCPSTYEYDVFDPSQSLTIFRTCAPNYVPSSLIRYIESSSPFAYPPSYEEAIRYPMFEQSVDQAGSNNNNNNNNNNTVRAAADNAVVAVARNPSSAVTFETSL
ncbi:Transmembrane protein 151 [Cinara cedri]|uniref:Transmembrane protein 151 n=1 Tax=Cinara cedri TaxID=506608 RepID=A0A5E4MB57_9HEMI|nr:Transmembrane protein 151 [Cinara cedri]